MRVEFCLNPKRFNRQELFARLAELRLLMSS